jgi:putative glutamine amidotransferase
MTIRVAIPRWHEVQLEWLHHYHDRLNDVGIETVDVTDTADGLRGVNGLLLTGGVDVDPALYGEAPHPMTQTPVPGRDALELALLREALSKDLPVLAICRGQQLLNVCLGGSLLQHIDNDAHVVDEGNVSRWHDVSLTPGSKLAAVLGGSRRRVNSRHHQAVTPAVLAPGLRVVAASDDGVVEGVESVGHRWVVGVQWHPERLEDEAPEFINDSRRLFDAFRTVLTEASRAEYKE